MLALWSRRIYRLSLPVAILPARVVGMLRLALYAIVCGTLIRRAHAGKFLRDCTGYHKPRRGEAYPQEQTGYDGYCKSCYKEKFPRKYRDKQEQRKKKCRFCGKQRELVRGIMCKPCHRSRACSHPDCSWFNDADEPLLCVACESREKNPHAAGKRCAIACPAHTTAAERDLHLCSACFDSQTPCSHCSEPAPAGSMMRAQCHEEHCNAIVLLCSACSGTSAGRSKFPCSKCWIQGGKLCVYCEKTPMHRDHWRSRACQACFAARSCGVCHAMPPASLETPQCGMCRSLALWCPDHTTPEERAGGLCRAHWDSPECAFCYWTEDPATKEPRVMSMAECATESCSKVVKLCSV